MTSNIFEVETKEWRRGRDETKTVKMCPEARFGKITDIARLRLFPK